MPIFEKKGKRVMYAHVPKTGGSSITAMAENNGWNKLTKHTHTIQHATKRVYESWRYDVCFSVVRDPIDRARSLCQYKLIPLDDAYLWLSSLFNELNELICDKTEQELLRMEQNNEFNENHILAFPQTWFISDSCEWVLYGKEDVLLKKHLGTSKRDWVYKSPDIGYVLNDYTKQLVKEFYKADYEFINKEQLWL
jgi:hypothetical protein